MDMVITAVPGITVVEAAGSIAIIMQYPTPEVPTPPEEFQTGQALLDTELLTVEMIIHQVPENQVAIYPHLITAVQELHQ